MQIKDFQNELNRLESSFKELLNNDAPDALGQITSDFFADNFQNEGFTDSGFQKWDEVKRRQSDKSKGAMRSSKILRQSGRLAQSIEIDRSRTGLGKVVVWSNPNKLGANSAYVVAQNQGTNSAGRLKNVTIPKRQFMGESQTLNKLIIDKLNLQLHDFFNK